MAAVTMNIDSAEWASPGTVSFANEAELAFDFGGDLIEHSSGTDDHISGSRIVNIRGLYTIGFDDRVVAAALVAKINTEADMVMKIKDMDAATGIQLTALKSRLQRVLTTGQHNLPTRYAAVFYSRSTDGTTTPVSATAY